MPIVVYSKMGARVDIARLEQSAIRAGVGAVEAWQDNDTGNLSVKVPLDCKTDLLPLVQEAERNGELERYRWTRDSY